MGSKPIQIGKYYFRMSDVVLVEIIDKYSHYPSGTSKPGGHKVTLVGDKQIMLSVDDDAKFMSLYLDQ